MLRIQIEFYATGNSLLTTPQERSSDGTPHQLLGKDRQTKAPILGAVRQHFYGTQLETGNDTKSIRCGRLNKDQARTLLSGALVSDDDTTIYDDSEYFRDFPLDNADEIGYNESDAE